MRILFLTRSFNSLAQRLYLDLGALGHELAVELDIADSVAEEAVALFQPSLVIAPFLKRAIPASVWRRLPCLVVHPGIVGDRGPSALDWAIAQGLAQWGVTVLQAEADMDAGPVWASERFALRAASKSSLYRNEVTEAASRAVCRAVQHFAATGQPPVCDDAGPPGGWQPPMRQADRRIDWQHDDTAQVLRQLNAGDGVPGVLDELFGVPCHLFDAHAEPGWPPGGPARMPGCIVARRQHAVLKATRDGGVWIGHVRRADPAASFKLPVSQAFPAETQALPSWDLPLDAPAAAGWRDIRYERQGDIGVLHFAFYNGAMGTGHCARLHEALQRALAEPTRVLLLMGGPDFWSNGIHLNLIEAADSPADESWRNIQAMDDLCLALIQATGQRVVAALQGNAGAGGAFMALAADEVWARPGVVLNPHYKNMGNLYGSEYWTYLLPRRLGARPCAEVMDQRLPISAARAAELGLVDAVFGETPAAFVQQALARARALAADPGLPQWLEAKRARRLADEAFRPLADYRAEELGRMHRNFYGFDPSYHIARSNFVRRVPPSWTPRHLAVHRRSGVAGARPPEPEIDRHQSP